MARDIASAVFKTAFEKRASFRGEATFDTWLHAIAFNQLRQTYSRRQIAPMEPLVNDEIVIDPADLTDALGRTEVYERVHECLRRLPKKYREALRDHFVEGYSIGEIARRRVPYGTILCWVFTAKRLLRHAWERAT
jgi:RNA polymerase sigma-70 factor (ECF subfamily)